MAASRCSALLATLVVIGFARPLAAEPASRALNWLVLEGACDASAADVARRVDAMLIGSRPPDARAWMNIEALAEGYRVTLRASRGAADLGVKRLLAPSCDDVVDAAVLVLSLALTELAAEVAPTVTTPTEPEPELAFAGPAVAVERDEAPRAAEEISHGHGRRLGMLVGVDTGTLEVPTAYVGAAVAVPVAAWELLGALRYGLPSEHESVETTTSEQVRRDFGALELSLCRGLGAVWRFSLCAGGEFGVVRVQQNRREGELEIDNDEDRARVAGVASARLGRRTGMFAPELEFTAAAAPFGPDVAPVLSLRLGAGVAVQF